jgi:hypothetical protein
VPRSKSGKVWILAMALQLEKTVVSLESLGQRWARPEKHVCTLLPSESESRVQCLALPGSLIFEGRRKKTVSSSGLPLLSSQPTLWVRLCESSSGISVPVRSSAQKSRWEDADTGFGTHAGGRTLASMRQDWRACMR